jgi:methionyl-tRNA formyltransferase
LIHASDLPKGKGWSPHVWAILKGANSIVVSLLNVSDPVDSGDIWMKREIQLSGTELYDEINHKLFSCEVELMSWFVENSGMQHPIKQKGDESFWRRRYPEDSRLDVYASIASQFDLLRVCDPDRFPAFLEFRGAKYILRIERQKGDM